MTAMRAADMGARIRALRAAGGGATVPPTPEAKAAVGCEAGATTVSTSVYLYNIHIRPAHPPPRPRADIVRRGSSMVGG